MTHERASDTRLAGCVDAVGTITPGATEYDPPLRYIRCTVAGNIKVVLADDEDAAAIEFAMAAGEVETGLQIKKCLAPSTGAGTFVGAR